MRIVKLFVLMNVIVVLVIIAITLYVCFGDDNLNITNNTITEVNNYMFDTFGGEMLLNVPDSNVPNREINTIIAANLTNLTVELTANTNYSMVCTYDIVYEWLDDSSGRYATYNKTTEGTELTIEAFLYPDENAYIGRNYIEDETPLSSVLGNNNSAVVVRGAQIKSIGPTKSTAVWALSSILYNLLDKQPDVSGRVYSGQFKVANVSCIADTASIPGSTGYWFALSIWNDSTEQYEPIYTYPNYGGTLQSNGTTIGHNVYIGQDSSKYYACATIQGHEVCLSQPYTQYGLEGYKPCDYEEIMNCSFGYDHKKNAKQAIYQAFIDAGINIDISNCNVKTHNIECLINNVGCGVNNLGVVYCIGGSKFENVGCGVDSSNRAFCSFIGTHH